MDQNNLQQPVEQNVQPAAAPSNGKALVAMICGIIGVIGGFLPATWGVLPPIITLVCAILGIVFGAKGMKVAKVTGTGKGMAVTGLVLGIIGTIFSAVGLICAAACSAAESAVEGAIGGDLDDLQDALADLEDLY